MTIGKIERTEAVANLEGILTASDGIMVARGDLAVEVGDAAVPALQKKMIRAARDVAGGDEIRSFDAAHCLNVLRRSNPVGRFYQHYVGGDLSFV